MQTWYVLAVHTRYLYLYLYLRPEYLYSYSYLTLRYLYLYFYLRPEYLIHLCRSHQPFFFSETRLNGLSYGIKVCADFSPVLSQFTRLRTDRRTNRQTDRILIARPRLHSMQRGKNELDFCRYIFRLLFPAVGMDESFPLRIHCCIVKLHIASLGCTSSLRLTTHLTNSFLSEICNPLFAVLHFRAHANGLKSRITRA